ncbi:MAG TPA: anaerobic glycerol-3-phosphate dehydrogenase subunit GlpA [Candidatus Limnocylindrales bacterium]|nr:anaerobic glycerol-3-phosphate dehydrogenase subunit GlpA [Candidatus Limnocylindrales bacterium]
MNTDVLIIGGGATGGGIAWDLALRGVRVVLAEMGDLATGTSGRYHGLLHSGARYAVRDAESARECIDENLILRRIAPEAIEDTSGFFALCPGDDPAFVEPWLRACAAAGIETRAVPLAEALKREPLLNPRMQAIYEAPDGSIDSWDLLHALQKATVETGRGRFLTYHRVESFHADSARVTGARLTNLRTGEPVDVTCAYVVNAAGPWAAEVGALAGTPFGMKLSRGAMLAFNLRWVNTVINKLRPPGDGDIFVPVGTVSVIGTTSVPTTDPADTRVERWEIERILDECEAMTPGISRARILRSWAGVRPLYDPGETADGRAAKRTFVVLDHASDTGVEGIASIVGGKLTTCRLMAERAADVVCAHLGVTSPCATASTPLPSPHHQRQRPHHLRGRLNALEHGEMPGALICECELVTAPQIIAALDAGQRGENSVTNLSDLRRDLRLGMGPCQGGFCAVRATGLIHQHRRPAAAESDALLAEFAERRFAGMRPLLWGHNLRQELLDEQIYNRVLGLSAAPQPIQTAPEPAPLPDDVRLPGGPAPRIVVIGAGLAGLTAALTAQELGARVEVFAAGMGTFTLMPGWIETGDVAALAANPAHPYHHAAGALAAGLGVLDRAIGLQRFGERGLQAISALGHAQPVAFGAGGALHALQPDDRVLVVGIEGWRDSNPSWAADALTARGYHAEAITIVLPHTEGNFDDWPLDYAALLDTEAGLAPMIRQMRARLGSATVVAFPAVLGFAPETRRKIAAALGLPILEIPTLPPSVPGQRLFRALRARLLAGSGRLTFGPRVLGVELRDGRATGVRVETAANGRARLVPADAVILATGGLYGGGLDSDYKGAVWETVLGLPVANVPPIEEWFTEPLLAGRPQPIHYAGLMTDDQLRPITESGLPFADNVFAAGRLLAGASPVLEGSAEGIDLATGAKAALNAAAALRERAAMMRTPAR